MFIKIMDAFPKQKVQIIHDIMLTLVAENLVDKVGNVGIKGLHRE